MRVSLFVVLAVTIFSGICAASEGLFGLREPDAWFSSGQIGISEVVTEPDGVVVTGRGYAAYKNKLDFSRLAFDVTINFAGEKDNKVVVQFDKERRDSSVHLHHLIDTSNRGYGLVFHEGGLVELVKTTAYSHYKSLASLQTSLDFSESTEVTISQAMDEEGNITIDAVVDGQKVSASDKLEDGYSASGFFNVTVYSGRTRVALRNIRYEGSEEKVTFEAPRAVYLADYFEEDGRRFVHWSYDYGTSDYKYVTIESGAGQELGRVNYPADFWTVPVSLEGKTLILQAYDVDGDVSEPVKIVCVDDHSQFYLNGEHQRVAVEPGEPYAGFKLMPSGEPFVVKGFNFVKLRNGEHANFEADTKYYDSYYDPYDAETVFKIMKRTGHNCLRVFIAGRIEKDTGVGGNFETTEGLYKPYIDNFIDFVARAKKYGVYIMPTFCDGELPYNRSYTDKLRQFGETIYEEARRDNFRHNVLYLTDAGYEIKKKFYVDFLNYMMQKDVSLLGALLSVELRNELYLRSDQWPFNLEEGVVTGPAGKQYDMGNDDERQALYDEGLLRYHQVMVDAIKEVDPNLLVSQGYYTLRIVGKDPKTNYGVREKGCGNPGFPPTTKLMVRTAIDFMDIHIYHIRPEENVADGYRADMETTLLYDEDVQKAFSSKPWILGEFGSFRTVQDTWAGARSDIMTTLKLADGDGAQGAMMWTFDTYEQRILWHAIYGGDSFLKKLAEFKATTDN